MSIYHCLEVTQLENKINQLEKNKVDVDSLRKNNEEFIKSNRLILKSKQRFRSEKLNVFTEEVHKTALSVNDDKIIQLMDSTETYEYGTNKEILHNKNKKIKSNNIIKRYKNDKLRCKKNNKKHKTRYSKLTTHEFLTIHTE